MPKLVYRVVSACGALGYGYPKESLAAAVNGRVDAIICDGGSMDAGPYYLGTGTEYFEREVYGAVGFAMAATHQRHLVVLAFSKFILAWLLAKSKFKLRK